MPRVSLQVSECVCYHVCLIYSSGFSLSLLLPAVVLGVTAVGAVQAGLPWAALGSRRVSRTESTVVAGFAGVYRAGIAALVCWVRSSPVGVTEP